MASGPLRKQIEVPLMDGEGNISVKDFLSNDIGISFFFLDYIMREFKGILLASNPLQEDLHIWAFSKDGNFFLKSAYIIAKGLNPLNLDTFNMWVWNSKTMSRIKFFLWLCSHYSIPTREVLGSRDFNLDTTCELCGMYAESIAHVCRNLGISDARQDFFGIPLLDGLKYNHDSHFSRSLICIGRLCTPKAI